MAEEAVRASNSKAIESNLDEGLKVLLDHVAAELAEEYVRLMEEAATAESAPPDPTPQLAIEGERP